VSGSASSPNMNYSSPKRAATVVAITGSHSTDLSSPLSQSDSKLPPANHTKSPNLPHRNTTGKIVINSVHRNPAPTTTTAIFAPPLSIKPSILQIQQQLLQQVVPQTQLTPPLKKNIKSSLTLMTTHL